MSADPWDREEEILDFMWDLKVSPPSRSSESDVLSVENLLSCRAIMREARLRALKKLSLDCLAAK